MDISIIIPVFDEEDNIAALYERTSAVLNEMGNDWEVICVNDGSSDSTLEKLILIHKTDPRWKIIDLSRNFGHQRSIWAGVQYASGNLVGIMDGDLQDAPEHFRLLKEELNKDYDVVYAVRKNRKENALKKSAYWFSYRMLKYVFAINIPLDSGDFCLMRKKVVDEIMKMPEQSLFFRGIRSWVGFRQRGIIIDRDARTAGLSKYSFRQLFKLAYNGIYSFSDYPIKFLGRLGLFIIIASIVYAIWILTKKLVWGHVPEGFTTLIIVILFFGGIQLVTIRILGEYVQRIYDESRKRPLYIIREIYGNLPVKK